MSVNDPVELPVDPSLYLCDGVAFEGSCVYFPITYGECNTIEDKFDMKKDGIRSAVSGPNNFCTMFTDEGCTGDEIRVDSPGHEDFSAASGDWPNKAKSYKCAAK
ncbi:hypothetical protein SLS56_010461 [Neofusicoccum ribis]|uniref:Uncharacterized protein n=1 Tax=Neofusicoccum ribis TaxID=45134 RepID=A0ABR3SEE5_9PEZI